ncbi:hypothetical protein VTO42DRAFT_1844 [Malbranchea cinnamomea]
MPALEKVDLRCAGQMKDSVLEYVMGRECRIRHLQLDACNLISDGCWKRFFERCGARLEVLKLSNLDVTMGDDTVAHLVRHCPNLRSLKLTECWKPGGESLRAIAQLGRLEHLSLHFLRPTDGAADELVQLIERVGANLRTLSLRGFREADDRVLAAIHGRCRQLRKLRLTDNAVFTDQGFAGLFRDWDNPGLRIVDLSGTRDVDSANPDGPAEPIGLASEGFRALMRHSGRTVRRLNISACRHISFAALSAGFGGEDDQQPGPEKQVDGAGEEDTEDKELEALEALEELDVSFQPQMDDYLVGRLLRRCGRLRKVIALGCFRVRDVEVPAGVALIGGVNAQRSIA